MEKSNKQGTPPTQGHRFMVFPIMSQKSSHVYNISFSSNSIFNLYRANRGDNIGALSLSLLLRWLLNLVIPSSSLSSSVSSAKSVNATAFSSSYPLIKLVSCRNPSSPLELLGPLSPMLGRWSADRRNCIDRRVWRPVIPSVGTPSGELTANRVPLGSVREWLRRYTPEKMMRKPHSREIVLTGSEVLKPRKRMKDAQRVAVVKVT